MERNGIYATSKRKMDYTYRRRGCTSRRSVIMMGERTKKPRLEWTPISKKDNKGTLLL